MTHYAAHTKGALGFYLDIGGRHRIRQIHDKFGKLFHIDDILGILRVRVDDLGTASHLEGSS